MRILIVCTGNACRSQMAEGLLKSLDPKLRVSSAGTNPASYVHPLAIRVMGEAGIDIRAYRPKPVELFLSDSFDYVITVCDNARESCPVFSGPVIHRVHMGFRDPGLAKGTEEEKMSEFRAVRDEMKAAFSRFLLERNIHG